MIETINKLNRISRQMVHEKGREPTPEELGERMDMPEDKVRQRAEDRQRANLHGDAYR